MHEDKHSISSPVVPAPSSVVPAPSSVVPAPSSVVPAKAGTQSCAKKNDKVVVLTNVFWAPAFAGATEREAGATEREAGATGKETLCPRTDDEKNAPYLKNRERLKTLSISACSMA